MGEEPHNAEGVHYSPILGHLEGRYSAYHPVAFFFLESYEIIIFKH